MFPISLANLACFLFEITYCNYCSIAPTWFYMRNILVYLEPKWV